MHFLYFKVCALIVVYAEQDGMFYMADMFAY